MSCEQKEVISVGGRRRCVALLCIMDEGVSVDERMNCFALPYL
jgi:hypothetical protein